MYFLTDSEQQEWRAFAEDILDRGAGPEACPATIRPELVPAFHFYIATFLAAHGRGDPAIGWAKAGTLIEEEGLFGCAFLIGFLHRYGGGLAKPAAVFADPRPFIHFTTVPLMQEARAAFVRLMADSLPAFPDPIRLMDIGCGNGALTVDVLSGMMQSGKIREIAEVLLIDPSPAMAALAEKTVRAMFPATPVRIAHGRIQDCSAAIDRTYDIAMSSLAYHHMPVEEKRIHLQRLKPWINHFLLFEMDADHDTHDRYSPALALAVYQSYGRIFDRIYAHDGPVELANECIDMFLMTEVASILSDPRGERSDYHMLRNQWKELLAGTLGPEFVLIRDSSCTSDEHMGLFMLHYGRGG